MSSPRFLPLLLLIGCPEASQLASAFQTKDASRSPPAPAPVNPLHDPRERRLRDVRQLTLGLHVASPQFDPDASSVAFLNRSDDRASVEMVSAVNPAPPRVLKLAVAGPPWELLRAPPGLCVAVAAPTCSLKAWPDLEGLSGCGDFTQVPISTAKGDAVTCPAQPHSTLPCVVGHTGAVACPAESGGGTDLTLKAEPGAEPMRLGPRGGFAFDPVFSPDGKRLVFVVRTGTAVRLWLAPVDHPDLAGPLGPEARKLTDPTFTDSNDELLFASTVDATEDNELDIDFYVISSGALERVTFTPGVDRFPVLSADGTLVFASERNADPGTLDLYAAKWQRDPNNQRK